MLEAIRSGGTKPPFFMVHGLHGVMPLGHALERALDRDRPIYGLHAQGIVGAEPPEERIEDMLRGYLAEIRRARPEGPYVLGGICAGGLVAMALARALAAEGERVGTVILVDPPYVPHSLHPNNRTLNPKADRRVYQVAYADVEQVLRSHAARFHLPFETNDPAQLRRAVEVGIAMVVAFCQYVPPRFEGPTEFIISAERAIAHFHPDSPWKDIVAQPGPVHVLPGRHQDLYREHLDHTLGLVRFALDAAL